MERVTPLLITNHYRRNMDTYENIQKRLDDTREMFLSADREKQIEMLRKSHSFAVISVQTPVNIHEDAFTKLWDGSPENNLPDALDSVNYKNNKADYIRHSLQTDKWHEVADLLEENKIDKAHKFILDEMKGVGPAKAPFVLSMLGFDEKMCIDANVISAMDLDGHITTVVVEKYDKICQRLRDKLPTLRDAVSPFLWQ